MNTNSTESRTSFEEQRLNQLESEGGHPEKIGNSYPKPDFRDISDDAPPEEKEISDENDFDDNDDL